MEKISINEFIIWDKETIAQVKNKAEEEGWQDMKDGRIDSIQYTARILAIHKWAKDRINNLDN